MSGSTLAKTSARANTIFIHFLTCHIPIAIDPCDYDDPIFMLFGHDLSKIQEIY